jgi:hypothetical protein
VLQINGLLLSIPILQPVLSENKMNKFEGVLLRTSLVRDVFDLSSSLSISKSVFCVRMRFEQISY